MGEVIGLIRVMPDGVMEDEKIHGIIDAIKKTVKEPARLGKIDVKEVAFGLRAINVTVVVPDEEGGLDPIAENIGKLQNVESAEVLDVGRM